MALAIEADRAHADTVVGAEYLAFGKRTGDQYRSGCLSQELSSS
jgi:hypothetical protein